MKRFSKLVFTAALVMFSGLAIAGAAADAVEIEGLYVRAVPPGQPNSAVFLTLRNTASRDHALVGGETVAAEVVELHSHVAEGGMVRMRRVDRIELPAGQEVTLKPGGFHLMLIGLKQSLTPGEEVAFELEFADGSRKVLRAPVQKIKTM